MLRRRNQLLFQHGAEPKTQDSATVTQEIDKPDVMLGVHVGEELVLATNETIKAYGLYEIALLYQVEALFKDVETEVIRFPIVLILEMQEFFLT